MRILRTTEAGLSLRQLRDVTLITEEAAIDPQVMTAPNLVSPS
jgi:hypothetical protein